MPRRRPELVLAALVLTYVAVFGWLTWHQQSNYGTFGYDMGLHDQGIWLTSRFERPFLTIRGMHYYGHHVNLVSLLYVPAYWLGAGPHFLYMTETVALALGAVPVWLLTRDRLATEHDGAPRALDPAVVVDREYPTDVAGWLALVPSAAFLLFPAVQWMNWWHWHPETMAVTPLLFAWWAATRKRWRWFIAFVLLALSTKEDVALAVMMLGVVLFLVRRERRVGALTAVAGAAWFIVCTKAIIPALLGGDPFYAQQLFPDFGDSLGSVLVGMLTHPGEVLSTALEADRISYYRELLAPVAFIPFAGIPLLLIGAPQIGVNVLSSLPGTHDIRFQYSAVVVAAVFIATVEGLGWLRRAHTAAANISLVLLMVSAVSANVAWSPSPIGRDYDTGIWARRIARHDTFDRAVAMVPDRAGVSASYYLIPHLTHRKHAYEWPNPWILSNWGLPGEPAPRVSSVEYLVLDTALGQERALLERLTGDDGSFDVLLDDEGIVVAKRRN